MPSRTHNGQPRQGRGSPIAWRVLLACAPIFGVAYLLLPTTGPARSVVYPVFGIVAMVAILVAVRRGSPPRPRSWGMVAIALALLAAGDITYTVLVLGHPDVPYPSIADAFYLAGYGTLAGGLMGLARGRMKGGDRAPLIDAAILASGAGSLFWIAIIKPSIDGVIDPLAAAVSLAYPSMDLVLLGLGLRVLMSTAERPRYLLFLTGGLALYFAADVIYAMAVLDGSYVDGHPVDALWVVGVTLWGVAALHPSMADPVSSVRATQNLTRSRLALLALASMLAPALLLVDAVAAGDGEAIGLVMTWTILFGLVLIRLATTVDELGISLHQRRRLQADLVHQANHDPLTRLANRTLFEHRLAEAMAERATSTGLVFLDLDDFKAINDTLGHASGDELLRVLAERIQRELRVSDLAARLGGDEFAILVEDCPDEATVRSVADRVLAVLRTAVSIGGRQLQVHASAGVALGRAGSTPMDLMRDADVAMYEAKSHGKDQSEIYEPQMHSRIIRSYQLRTELAHALEDGQFYLDFQPAVWLETGEIVGAEALVRWQHPERGLVPPGDFIPQAESSGLINDLGRWILREACATAAAWPVRPSGRRAILSVNLSAGQLHQPGLVDDVADILAETGLPAAQLCLEVTESGLVALGPAREALDRLRALGVRLALDDFGTGYSALSYLADLPFDIVKIDRSFVSTNSGNRRVEALLDGIVGLCRALELTIVAEGIEDAGQLQRVRQLGCQVGQGYYLDRPMGAAAFALRFAAGGPADGRPSGPGFGGLSTIGARRATSPAS